MGRQVYQESQFKVYRAGNDYIIHNSAYTFSEFHTHLKSLAMCKQIISCLLKRRMPKTRNTYVLTSIVRLCDDPDYKSHVEAVIKSRQQKGKKLNYKNHAF